MKPFLPGHPLLLILRIYGDTVSECECDRHILHLLALKRGTTFKKKKFRLFPFRHTHIYRLSFRFFFRFCLSMDKPFSFHTRNLWVRAWTPWSENFFYLPMGQV